MDDEISAHSDYCHPIYAHRRLFAVGFGNTGQIECLNGDHARCRQDLNSFRSGLNGKCKYLVFFNSRLPETVLSRSANFRDERGNARASFLQFFVRHGQAEANSVAGLHAER